MREKGFKGYQNYLELSYRKRLIIPLPSFCHKTQGHTTLQSVDHLQKSKCLAHLLLIKH